MTLKRCICGWVCPGKHVAKSNICCSLHRLNWPQLALYNIFLIPRELLPRVTDYPDSRVNIAGGEKQKQLALPQQILTNR